MERHGVIVQEVATSISAPSVAPVSVPFVIGAAPVQSAADPAAVGEPMLCRDWQEAIKMFGYSEDWEKYNLCEFMFSHFKLYERSPVILCNLLDPDSMSVSVPAADKAVADKRVMLPIGAINNGGLVVSASGSGSTALEKGVDYETFYSEESMVIELLEEGSAYDETNLSVAYKTVTPESVTATLVATGFENIEKCMSSTGVIPDLLVSPGYSTDPTVAAIMATKTKVNGLFGAKALIDINTKGSNGAKNFNEAIVSKEKNNLTDKNQIVCWPMLGIDGKKYHMSTHLAGVFATVDGGNDGIPYESPSNKPYIADSIVLDDGTPVTLSHAQANTVEGRGIVTALKFLTGLVCWGNFTACYPLNTDDKDRFISINRMFDWVGNTLIRTHWRSLDKPMIPRIIDSIVDGTNIWLNGLVGGGYLLGGYVVFTESENKLEDLSSGIIKVRIFLTPPPPLREINFILEYDLSPFLTLFS